MASSCASPAAATGSTFELTGGRAITVYAQHEVLKDLIRLRLETGGQIHVRGKARPSGRHGRPAPIRFTTKRARPRSLPATSSPAATARTGYAAAAIPEGTVRQDYFRVYPAGWFGILAKAPPSSDELIYAHHERGFALVSTRSPDVQRIYFQCDPADSVDNWPDERIWEELQARVAGDGFSLKEGAIFQKGIIPLRSFVGEPMQHGRLFLAGDAAHSCRPPGPRASTSPPPTCTCWPGPSAPSTARNATDLLDAYTRHRLRRVWRAQRFSWWMTSLLHRFPDDSDFDRRRQLAELDLVTSSRAAATTLAENYVGLPLS